MSLFSKLPALLFVVFALRAQQSGNLNFPSDLEDPGQFGPLALELLRPSCGSGTLAIKGVIRGHFLSPASVDVLANVSGCQPTIVHGEGATRLLTREANEWKVTEFRGMEMSTCHKMAQRDGRDMLVCIWWAYSHGLAVETLSLFDLTSYERRNLVTANDDSGTCGMGWLNPSPGPIQSVQVTREFIERVQFQADASNVAKTMKVTVQQGTRWVTPEEREACAKGAFDQVHDPRIVAVRPSQITFRWDGSSFVPDRRSLNNRSLIKYPQSTPKP